MSQSQQPNENTRSVSHRLTEKQGASQQTEQSPLANRQSLSQKQAVPSAEEVATNLNLLITSASPTEAKRRQDEWAQRLDFATVVKNSSGVQFALIPPGQFQMGSGGSSPTDQGDEQPQHLVTISRPFFISSHEITIEQFSDFVKATGYGITQRKQGRDRQKEATRRGPPPWARGGGQVNQNENNENGQSENRDDEKSPTWLAQIRSSNRNAPIVHVSWNDAQAWCRWLSQKESKTYRLPTEAEWEYAARGGTQTDFYSGDEKSLLNFAWFEANSGGEAQIVGRKRPNIWGLYDMFGNAREWCDDRYGEYRDSAQADPQGASRGDVRVVRGGEADATPVRAGGGRP